MDDLSISSRFGTPLRPRSSTRNYSPAPNGSPTPKEDREWADRYARESSRMGSPTRMGSPARASSPTRASTPSAWDKEDRPSPVELVHKTEMLRIQGMLQQTQDELEKTNREVSDAERYRKFNQQRRDQQYQEDIDRLTDTIRDLTDQIRHLEGRAEDAEKAKDEANQKLDRTLSQLKQTEEQLEARITMCRNKAQQVADLTIRIHDLSQEKDNLTNKSQTEVKEQIEQVVQREHTISMHESRIKASGETIRLLRDENEKLKRRLEDLEHSARGLERSMSETKDELYSTKGELKFHQSAYNKDLMITRKLEQLKSDNARLMHMLSRSRQYDDFVAYVEESRGVAYLPPQGADMQEDQFGKAAHTYSFKNDREVEASSEWKYWVPEDAIAVVNDFKAKHLPHVPVALFSEVMTRLNQIWRRREKKKILSLKNAYEEEIQALRRQLSQRMPYEEVISTQKIDHLKRELKRERDSPKKRGDGGLSPVMLDSTLNTVEHLAKQLSELQSENGRLYSIAGSVNRTRDAMFLEGAAWLGKKVVAIADRMGDKVGQLVTAFQVKARHAALVPTSSLLMSQSRLEDMDDFEVWESYPSEPAKGERLPQHVAEARLVKLQEVFLRYLEKQIISFREKLRRLFEKVLETSLEAGDEAVELSF